MPYSVQSFPVVTRYHKKTGQRSGDLRIEANKRTDINISFIHCTASPPPDPPASLGLVRVNSVPRISIRLGNALLGATPAKPANTACINDRPCAVRSDALCTRRTSVRDDRLTIVVYKSMLNQN